MGPFAQLAQPRALRVLLPVGLLLAALSGVRLWQEHCRLQNAVAVPAEVLAARVAESTSGSGASRERHYRPEVRFRFELDGERHESTRVTPLGDHGSRAWARQLVARFPVGSSAAAWVPPDAPAEAYLVKQRSWKPPAGLAAGLLIGALAGWGLWRQRGRRAGPGQQDDGQRRATTNGPDGTGGYA